MRDETPQLYKDKTKAFYVMLGISMVIHGVLLLATVTPPHTEEPRTEFKQIYLKFGGQSGNIAQNESRTVPMPISRDNKGNQDRNRQGNADKNQEEITPKTASKQPRKLEESIQDQPLKTDGNHLKSSEIVSVSEDVRPLNNQNVDSSPKLTKQEQQAYTENTQSPFEPVADQYLDDIAPAAGGNPDEGHLLGNDQYSSESDLRYEKILSHWFNKFREYPQEAQQQGLTGKGVIHVTINREGWVLDAHIKESTQYAILDKALLQMVSDANPVIPVPEDYMVGKQSFPYIIEFEF